MSTLQSSIASSIASILLNAGIQFSGGAWLRLKGKEYDAISVNAESGGGEITGQVSMAISVRLAKNSALTQAALTLMPMLFKNRKQRQNRKVKKASNGRARNGRGQSRP